MADKGVHYLSLITAPVEVISATGAVLGPASSFFYKRDDDWNYLVTNWHVVTGRHPATPHKSDTGAVPTELRLILHKNLGTPHVSMSQKVECVVDINDEHGEAPEWLEHPDHRYKVDIAVVKIENDDEFKSQVNCNYLAEYGGFTEKFSPEVMDDVIVFGYPWNLSGGDLVLPLFKRGSVASEPIVPYGGLPRFLIDCRTAKGMSGSPVICARSGVWMPSGEFNREALIGGVKNFAGVYSGRLTMDDPDKDEKFADRISEIGIVWKKEIIDEIIDKGMTGTKLSEL